MEKTHEDLFIESASWITNRADVLLKKVRACKTHHAKMKLFPEIEYILKKLHFEKTELEKILPNEETY
jgi:hypothetical protein